MHPADLLLDTVRLGDGVGTAGLVTEWDASRPGGLDRLVHFEGGELWLERRLHQLAVDPVAGFSQWLSRSNRGTLARAMLVEEAAADALREIAAMDLPVILLKGVARRAAAAAGLHPWADARATHDVDLLLPESAAAAVWERLCSRGYAEAPPPPGGPFRTVHLKPIWNRHRVTIEIHTSTDLRVPPALAWQRQANGGRTVSWLGISCLIPSATELLWHAVTHSLQHGALSYRLRYFLDAVALFDGGGAAVDWPVMAARLAAGSEVDPESARAWLGTAAAIAGVSLPLTLSTLPYRRLLHWRFDVLRRVAFASRVGEKLILEGTLAEMGLPLTPGVAGTSVLVRARRRSAAAAARAAYLLWRGARRVDRGVTPAW